MTDTDYRLTRTGVTGVSRLNQSQLRFTSTRSGLLVETVIGGVKLWRRVRQAAGAMWKWVRATVTPVGWLVVGVAVVGLGLGLRFGWMELMAAGSLAATLLVLCAPFLVGLRSYSVDLSLTRDRVVAGAEVQGSISIVNSGRRLALPGRIDVPVGEGLVAIPVPLLRAGQSHDETVFVPAQKRGVISVGPARTVRGDPIGVLSRELLLADENLLYVHPVTTTLPSTGAGLIRDLEGDATAVIVDADISFHDIREYQPGDAQRQIHWKSTAKTGALMVRQYEETRRSRMSVVLALGTEDYLSDDEFELAVSAVGSLGLRAIRDGRSLDVVVGGEVPEFVRKAVRSVRELRTTTTRVLLDELAAIDRLSAVVSLPQACSLASELHPDVSIAFIVCGAALTARQLQAAALSYPANVAVVAIVCDLNAEPSIRTLGEMRVVTIALLEDLRQLLFRRSQS